jgi:hypothetical protein
MNIAHLRLVLASIAVGLVGALTIAQPSLAAKPRPQPLPAPAPAVVTNIVVNEATQGGFVVTNPGEFGVDYVVQIVGPPVFPVPDYPGVTTNGYVAGTEGRLTGLLPATTYTVTVFRHRFYDSRTNQAVNLLSAPTSFTFTTPTLAATRPSRPVISITNQTPSLAYLAWAPSTDNVSSETQLQYIYTVAGDPQRSAVPTCSSYCFGVTGTAIIKPPPGVSISVTVTAIDGAGIRSLPSNAVVITG